MRPTREHPAGTDELTCAVVIANMRDGDVLMIPTKGSVWMYGNKYCADQALRGFHDGLNWNYRHRNDPWSFIVTMREALDVAASIGDYRCDACGDLLAGHDLDN